MNGQLPRLKVRHALLALPLLAVYIAFRKIIHCPGCYLFVNSSDGLKNYFTFAWYLNYDKGLWFTGMNYPYGEHIVFTDNQPVWALLFNFLDGLGLPFAQYPVATMNFLLIGSLLAAIYILTAILRRFRLPLWYSVVISIIMVFLSPQVSRFHGHYSLAYVVYLPLLLLLLFRLSEKADLKRAFGLLAAVIWMSLTHVYFFMITILFLSAYLFVDLLKQSGRRKLFRIYLGGVVIVAVAGMFTFMQITDPVEDRPEEAYGILNYRATANGTFFPWYRSMRPFAKDTLGLAEPDFESKSYVGLVPGIFLFWLIISLLVSRKMRRHLLGFEIFRWLLAGALVWLFATGILYQSKLRFVLDMIPPLKQFRSLGRLAWVFYYTLGISSAYILYLWFRNWIRRGHVLPGLTGLLLALGLWGLEAVQHAEPVLSTIDNANVVLDRKYNPYSDFLAGKGLDPQDFQGQLLLPLCMVGAEKLAYHKGIWSMREGMQCAYETGIPLIDFNLSRTSVSQALNLLQLPGPDFLSKSRAYDMNDKPILVLIETEFAHSVEMEFVRKGTFLGSVGPVDVYSMEMSTLKQEQIARGSLSERCDTTAVAIIENGFENFQAKDKLAYTGSGSLELAEEKLRILELPRYILPDSTNYIFSFWAYVDARTSLPFMVHTTLDDNGDVSWEREYSFHDFYPCDVMGNWLRFNYWFAHEKHIDHVFTLVTRGAVIDNLMLRKDNQTICRLVDGDMFMYNNFWLPLNQ